MKQVVTSERRWRVLISLSFLAAVTSLAVIPAMFVSNAGEAKGEGLFAKTASHDEGLPNYDIRSDKGSYEKLAGFRSKVAKDAAMVADIRDGFARGEDDLRKTVPTLKIEYNSDIRIPEVIAPDPLKGKASLTGPSAGKRSDVLKGFLKENAGLVGVAGDQIDGLKVAADYTNPDGKLSFVELNQEINGIPVFRGEVKAGFSKNGEMFRVINNLAPGLDNASLSADFGDPALAVKAAAGSIGHELRDFEKIANAADSNDLKTIFGDGDWATTAEKMYFPTEPGVAVPAWRVLIWQPVSAYYVIVDAHSGTMLWRKNITEDQTQSATFQVYTNTTAMVNSAQSPAPLSPGPIDPGVGTQGPLLSRTSVSRIGNEAPYAFVNNGWITDGGNVTDGNFNEAGIDRDGVNGVDAPQPGDGTCPGAGCRVFTSTWNPPPGNPAPGDTPLTPQAQRGAVIQMFYAMNLYQSEMYRLGFTEQARNFQADNFGRGGVGADRVSSEGQDSSGTNNANFSTPADGGRGRMQMYIFTGPDPDRDGTTDIDIVYHEVTHGLSNRLHGNGSGLSLNMSRGMGEGWSDFYAHSMLSDPDDPLDGVYTTGGYVLITPSYSGNFYYGIRRFPKARMSFTGGPSNRPHNPLTFADIDGTKINLTDGAFAPRGGGSADQVHNAGEVWSSALWEVRAKYIERLGWAVGNRQVLQFVTDGMKLAPLGPTFLTERDAIVAAVQASGTAADVADTWAGFAIRGMGFSASIQATGSGSGNARVTEAFDLPNLVQTPTFNISDAGGNNNGVPDPGENLTLFIPLTNNTGNTATNVTLQVVGGGSANYGNIANGQTVLQQVSYTVPANTPCGSSVAMTFNVNSSLGATSFDRSLVTGAPQFNFSQNFDGVTAPALPAGWTAAPVQNGTNFVTATFNADSVPNAMFALNPATVGGGTDLTSPEIAIQAAAGLVTFRNRYDTEAGWDGGVLEISIAGGAFQDIITAGGSFVQNGYVGTLGANGTNNPLNGRNSWNGNSGGYIDTVVRMPAAAAGQNVRLKWRFGADDNTVGQGPNPGWYIDNVQVAGSYACAPVTPSTVAPFDYDGDGKTDISIFRPAVGEWWHLRSSDGGNRAFQFGSATDVLVPGDYTGDLKTDNAFYRNGEWFVMRSNDFSFYSFPFGTATDVPAPADFDGDGKTDAAVFRPSSGDWFIQRSSDNQVVVTQFGAPGDLPAAADYDGDGKADVAIYRPSAGQWWLNRSTAGVIAFNFGTAGDRIVPGDYTGDGKADVAVFRAGTWYVLRSNDLSFYSFPFGAASDMPSPGDYDGDGKIDAAVFRPTDTNWYVQGSTSGTTITQFGATGDKPVPGSYVRQ
ncbi:MAG: M36 family metallopeptidase [Pyrinomonadaceae bacterium]|nr:M36 family metallopeptidase [Pyrinomonadaceae bacterium]